MATEKPQLSEKAVRYIEALSQARCEGRWSEVPELARKVEKHSGRKCLAQAARTQAAQEQRIASRPADSLGVSAESLLAVISDASGTKEDQFQGRVCAQWLYWIDGKYEEAILAVPSDVPPPTETEKTKDLMGWTLVCAVQGAFVRGACYEAVGKTKEAVNTYREAAARVLGPSSVTVVDTTQYKYWTERLLNRYCRISEIGAEPGQASADDVTDTLEVFRAWSRSSYGEVGRSGISTGGMALEDQLSRRGTLLSYHKLLSSMVARLSGNPEHLSLPIGDVALPSRLDLCGETRHVESAYETMLLREVSFPQASDYNSEVEDWINKVMVNWAAFVGPAWGNTEVPQPGKRAISKSMLDTLYRASAKTFHSMAVLRHLSTVHTSLGEFELAARALDSYITLVTKAKARIQKSGENEPGIDNDDVMVNAIAAGIDMLCTAGHRKEAIRAQELATLLARMIEEGEGAPVSVTSRSQNQAELEKIAQNVIHVNITPESLAAAHRSIGISNARWAQLIYDPERRNQLQVSSIRHLKSALRGAPSNESNIEALYALGLACAEARDTQGALAAVKEALLQTLPQDEGSTQPSQYASLQKARAFSASTKCWHLLTLLLTSRQDFDNAAASCDEAIEQLDNETKPDLFSRMSIMDKQNLISLRASRISLKQVLESTESAINESTSLLALHGELFSEVQRAGTGSSKSAGKLALPSIGSGGKAFSIRGSILGRSKADPSTQSLARPDRPKTAQRESIPPAAKAPTLAVPEEQGEENQEESKRPTTSYSTKSSVSRTPSNRLQKRPSQKRVGSRQAVPVKVSAATDTGGTKATPQNVNKGAAVSGAPHLEPILFQEGNSLLDGGKLTPPVKSAVNSLESFVPCPAVHYSEAEYLRRSNEILISIWIFISSLYRQAGLYSDSAESIHEAFDLVREIEAEVAKLDKSSAEEFERPAWGGSKSIEELWADAYAEKGRLRLAQSRAFAAMAEFESALAHFPDHVAATVSLANILLDIYSGKVVVPDRIPGIATKDARIAKSEPVSIPILATVPGVGAGEASKPKSREDHARTGSDKPQTGEIVDEKPSHSADALDKLAARDRAYSLLSTLSKLGSGWDQSEVWFALSRAYEESGQLDKAQEALWWVVELEKKRPIRDWSCLGQGYNLWL